MVTSGLFRFSFYVFFLLLVGPLSKFFFYIYQEINTFGDSGTC